MKQGTYHWECASDEGNEALVEMRGCATKSPAPVCYGGNVVDYSRCLCRGGESQLDCERRCAWEGRNKSVYNCSRYGTESECNQNAGKGCRRGVDYTEIFDCSTNKSKTTCDADSNRGCYRTITGLSMRGGRGHSNVYVHEGQSYHCKDSKNNFVDKSKCIGLSLPACKGERCSCEIEKSFDCGSRISPSQTVIHYCMIDGKEASDHFCSGSRPKACKEKCSRSEKCPVVGMRCPFCTEDFR